jgi:deoxyadenosine/deoxycytidine kinase
MEADKSILIGVVGPCAAGKSTLIAGLEGYGYQARHIAQEHSFVQDMWKRLTNPDVLVFLQASYPVTCQRLSHARLNADLFVETDKLSIEDVLQQVLDFLEGRKKD